MLARYVCRNGFDAKLGSFVQAYGSKALDASLLLLPIVGFLPSEDAPLLDLVIWN
jgi:GH15 family glucan-1,4-alpha-glucosidase